VVLELLVWQLQNSQLNLSLWLLITKPPKEKELLQLLAFGIAAGKSVEPSAVIL